MPQTLSPSQLARRVASQMWPDVQHSYKIAPGVFDHVCAGHGGAVSVIDASDLPADVVQIAARHNLLTKYVVYQSAGRVRLELSRHKDSADWARWKAHPGVQAATVQSGQVWIGEEDCAWSTIAYATEQMSRAWATSRAATSSDPQASEAAFTRDLIGQVCRTWYPQFAAEIDALHR